MQDGGKVVLGIGAVGLLAWALIHNARGAEGAEVDSPIGPPGQEIVEVIDAELRSGYVFWAGLTAWKQVYTRWPNEWPADTDIQFAWEIKNIGNVGAYFQVYAFDPGSWMYLDPGEKVKVYEDFHTPTIPVTPGYEFARITILGRNITGERVGAVWTSEEFEIIYV